jgi:two-component system, sensor histidine kinase
MADAGRKSRPRRRGRPGRHNAPATGGSAVQEGFSGLAARASAGALAALAVLALVLAWHQRRAGWALASGALLAATASALAWPGAALPLALMVLAGAAELLRRHLGALRATQARLQQLQRRTNQGDAEIQALQQQLQQAQAASEAAEQAKARFFAAASHDLRQPAHALGLYMAALRAGPLAPAQAEIAERMQGSLAALDALFGALLDVSRMDAGAVAPQWDTVALAPLLRRLADEWALQAENRGLRLALHVADPGALTVTDAVLLERVLRNLLGNAVKYTERGGVLLACRLRRSAAGEPQHRIEVWDSGPGIAPAEQERVFEEFYQGPGAAHRASGDRSLGLGLAIVQRLARLLQLRVTLHSRPGRGSVFMLEGLAPAGDAPQAAASARLRMRQLAGLHVAVLEDDPEVRDAMRRLLQRWDCRVVDGGSAAELLQRLPTPARPDALVADLRLEDGRHGLAEQALLQAAWSQPVPVLWVSGESAHGLPPGAALLTKPVSPARLRAWLEQCLPDRGDGP